MDTSLQQRKNALSAVGRAWNESAICYAVAHGIEGFPDKIGRDIDVLIARDDIPRALTIAQGILEKHGYTVVHPPDLWGARILGIDPLDWNASVEVHSLQKIGWRNISFTRLPESSDFVGPFAVDPWASVAKRILTPLFSGEPTRFIERHEELALSSKEKAAIERRLTALCGKAISTQLLAALESRDLARLRQCVPALKKSLMRQGWLRSPVASFLNLSHTFLRRPLQIFYPCAPVLLLVGMPEQDLGEVLHDLKTGPRSLFTKIIVRDDFTTPESVRTSGFRQLLRQGKRLLRDRIDSARQRLVLYHAPIPPRFLRADETISYQPGSPRLKADQIREAALRVMIRKLQSNSASTQSR